MLRRIQKIEGIGSFHSARAGNTQFSDVNIIYGENRNGKSTLCDIFYSLSVNNPVLIKDRKTIPAAGVPVNAMKVELQFDGVPVVRFSNNQWETNLPDDSQLHIFDHNFIHRNVMSGTVNNRENSEHVSSFILGENGTELFETLKAEKEALSNTKAELKIAKTVLENNDIEDITGYVSSDFPVETIEELDIAINTSRAKQDELTVQIGSIDQSKNRDNLKTISSSINITSLSTEINECLALNMEEVHSEAKALVNEHTEHIKQPDTFKGWVIGGLSHLDNNCPFCGQVLDENAGELIDSYKVAFDEAFSNFIRKTKATVTNLLSKQLVNFNAETIIQLHRQNLQVIAHYNEESVLEKLAGYAGRLEKIVDAVNFSINSLNQVHIETKTQLQEVLNTKFESPYNALEAFDFSTVQTAIELFHDAKESYKVAVESVNEVLIEFKGGLDPVALTQLKTEEYINQIALESKKLRHTLEEKCGIYRALNTKVEQGQEAYDNNKQALEDSQEEFLDNYFEQINDLFRSLGSRNFTISRKQNNGGKKIIYDLEVSFNGTPVHRNKMNCLFSESDRRALALCIYLAKIIKLSDEDKAKAILVMDDPVTSFDNERISSILNKLYDLEPSIKQLFITTHYRGMASTAIKKFNNTSSLKIIRTPNGSDFTSSSEAEMTSTEHDDAYNEIVSFISNVTQDNKVLKLRPFLETELRHRYKDQLRTHGATLKTDFSICINTLKENGIISDEIAIEIHGFRTMLNPQMHQLMEINIEDARNIATDMMELIYNRM